MRSNRWRPLPHRHLHPQRRQLYSPCPASLIFIGDDGQGHRIGLYEGQSDARKLGVTAQVTCASSAVKPTSSPRTAKRPKDLDGYLTVTNAETMTYVT
ncbi:MAG: hypothetical protein ACLR8Y_01780 [Alistipes indistinctus]